MTWQLDKSHSAIGFAVRHMMMSTVRGSFGTFRVDADIDPAAPARGRVRVEVEAASVNTGDEKRDGHLRSADFFDAVAHPVITFTSTAIEPRGGQQYAIHGDLTIRGTTKPITLDAELHGQRPGLSGGLVAGISASVSIDRRDFGLVWNVPLEGSGVLVGESVKLEIDLELIQQAVVTAA